MRSIAVLAAAAAVAGSCATKTFEEPPALLAGGLEALSCAQLDGESLRLRDHVRRVDKEASTGLVEQWFWGGMFSVMADQKLEAEARRRIREREDAIAVEKARKGCRSQAAAE